MNNTNAKRVGPKTVVLVDGMNLAFRMYAVSLGFTTSDGQTATGVIFGMLRAIRSAYKFADSVVVCWEGGRSWRKDLKTKKAYKGGRDADQKIVKIREELFPQIKEVQRILKILRITQVSISTLEADDTIGVLSKTLCRRPFSVRNVLIMSSDRDFFQCVSGKVAVIRYSQGKWNNYSPERVESEQGVTVKDWAKYKALHGDVSDGYSGLPGVGPVKAKVMLAMGALPQKRWSNQPVKFRNQYKSLKQHWKQARQCYTLARIPREVEYKYFNEEAKEQLRTVIAHLPMSLQPKLDTRSFKHAMREFMTACGRFQLDTFMVERRSFFGHIVIINQKDGTSFRGKTKETCCKEKGTD